MLSPRKSEDTLTVLRLLSLSVSTSFYERIERLALISVISYPALRAAAKANVVLPIPGDPTNTIADFYGGLLR